MIRSPFLSALAFPFAFLAMRPFSALRVLATSAVLGALMLPATILLAERMRPSVPSADAPGTWASSLPAWIETLALVPAALVGVMIAAAAWRAMLGRDGPAALPVRLGGDEARLVACLILTGLIVLAPAAVLWAGGVLWAAETGVQALPRYTAPIGLGLSAILLVRFSLTGPATIAHGGLGLARSWSVSLGAFWRLVGLYGVWAGAGFGLAWLLRASGSLVGAGEGFTRASEAAVNGDVVSLAVFGALAGVALVFVLALPAGAYRALLGAEALAAGQAPSHSGDAETGTGPGGGEDEDVGNLAGSGAGQASRA